MVTILPPNPNDTTAAGGLWNLPPPLREVFELFCTCGEVKCAGVVKGEVNEVEAVMGPGKAG